MSLVVFFILASASFLLLNIPFPKKDKLKNIRWRKEKHSTVKEYLLQLTGKERKNLLQTSLSDAKHVFALTGQPERFRKTLLLSGILAGIGVTLGLMSKTYLLAPVLGLGLYFLPLWLTQFKVYTYNAAVSEELEGALSLITTAYVRTGDILSAVSDNTKHLRSPVKEAFISFVNCLHYVDSNVVRQIVQLRNRLDNKIFWQWCDALVLCQQDKSLSATLMPIVTKLSDLRAADEENKTNMLLPLKNASIMVAFTLGSPVLLYFINREWFEALVGSVIGQFILAATAIMTLVTINKAIRLSRPVE